MSENVLPTSPDQINDPYRRFVRSKVGKLIARQLGLPIPPVLQRFTADQLEKTNTVTIGGGSLCSVLPGLLPKHIWQQGDPKEQCNVLIFDARDIFFTSELTQIYTFFHHELGNLAGSGRVIIIGTSPQKIAGAHRVAQRSLEGFMRSLAKELRFGSTAQLIYCDPLTDAESLLSTLEFLLSSKSAFVDGQVFRLNSQAATNNSFDPIHPLKGKIALVTGAARGIGATISQVLARDGAHIIAVDVPAAQSGLEKTAEQLSADTLLLDIVSPDSAQQMVHFIKDKYGTLDILVHNAGITRDKLLVNMTREQWESVISVNLTAQEKIIATFVNHNLFSTGAAITSISSISGIAGQKGQTNYAASKAGIIGLVEAYTDQLRDRGIRINAIAPGFIETAMTAQIPFRTRTLGRLMSTLQQGGLPIDVAEIVALFAKPQSYALTGNVIRVCGQNLLGA